MNRTQITLQFDDKTGIQHLYDIDQLPIPPEISHATKSTITTELNMKMSNIGSTMPVVFSFLLVLLVSPYQPF